MNIIGAVESVHILYLVPLSFEPEEKYPKTVFYCSQILSITSHNSNSILLACKLTVLKSLRSLATIGVDRDRFAEKYQTVASRRPQEDATACRLRERNGERGVADGPKRRSATFASVHYAVTQFRSLNWVRFGFSSNHAGGRSELDRTESGKLKIRPRTLLDSLLVDAEQRIDCTETIFAFECNP